MMVLCPYCHDGATKGAFDEKRQRQAKSDPFNVRRGYASGALMINQSYAAIGIGECLLVGDKSGIRIDGLDLLRLDVDEDGLLLLTVHLEDEYGEALAVIDKNEWVSGDPHLWDMRSDHQKLKLWIAERKIRLDINATGSPIWLRADLWHSGQLVRLGPNGISMDGQIISGSEIQGVGLVGMRLDLDSSNKGTASIVPYLGKGMLVGESDPFERLKKSVNGWARLSGAGGVFLN